MKNVNTMNNSRKWWAVAVMVLLGGYLQAQTAFTTDGQVVIADASPGVTSGFYARRGDGQDLSKLTGIDRDIAIMENVLGDLFKRSKSSFGRSSNRARGIHIPNTGVIFNVSGNRVFGGGDYQSWNQLVYIVDGDEVSSVGKNYSPEELDKLNAEKEKKMEELAKTFLANYGSLLEDLGDNEKVQLSIDYSLHVQSSSRKIDGQLAFVSSSRNENKRRMIAQVNMSDVRAYASGSMSESQIFSKINIKGHKDQAEEKVDMKIFANIFDELFNNSFHDRMYDLTGQSSWTYFEGFGLMYNVRIHTHRDRYAALIGGKVTNDDFNKKAEEVWPEFEKSIKESLLKYGRTVRSLKAGEVIVLNVSINSLRNAKSPKTLRMTVSKNDIDAYAKGNKSLDKAMDAIDVKRLSSALNSNSRWPSRVDRELYNAQLGRVRTVTNGQVR